ncbi:MAG: LysR family transcriptional regulator [Pseudomonadota bacterium]
MTPEMDMFDWTQVRAFLAAAETGSFSAAARSLRQTQPTLGRQVAALERDLGVTLFQRGARTLVLTDAGLDLLEHARSMRDAAASLALAATGQATTIAGKVTISCSELMAIQHLPPIIAELSAQAPGLEVEIVASDALSDLRRREADIAIRHVRPEQPDLIAKLVQETTAHLYATKMFLDRHGRPSTAEQVSALPFICIDEPDRILPYLNGRGLSLTRDSFRWHSQSSAVIWALMQQNLGVSILTARTVVDQPNIEMVWPAFEPIPVPVWLVTHAELKTSPRIRLVFDLLADRLAMW